MAKTLKQTKNEKFAKDLSNYTQIRRGLSPNMREIVPSKKELLKTLSEIPSASQLPGKTQKLSREQSLSDFIDQLNAYREAPAYGKRRGMYEAESSDERRAKSFLKNNGASGRDKLTIIGALVDLKAAPFEIAAEAQYNNANVASRARTGSWYAAKSFHDKGDFSISRLSNKGVLEVMDGLRAGDITLTSAEEKELQDRYNKLVNDPKLYDIEEHVVKEYEKSELQSILDWASTTKSMIELLNKAVYVSPSAANNLRRKGRAERNRQKNFQKLEKSL